ncbi:hypothetical protein V757_09795 [Pelistega indica]|uniref:DUF4435 domain-containing protein n=1 Tax=Pelistega indica TaxID=1414851 RepID=V8FX06_9BURK|nr:hypothetical protein [Pelistega indica]ETD68809.1 hypothetical protein V757_09795 [Pelistega indica]
MGKKSRRRFYLVEGETEKVLLDALRKAGMITPGSVHQIDCWRTNPQAILRRLPRESAEVVIVFDTDRLDRLDSFCEVLRLLNNQYHVYLVQQMPNLEGELVYSCTELTKQLDLFKAFGCSSANEFKSNFLSTSNITQRLEQLGFDMKELWSRPLHNDIQKGLGNLVLKMYRI